MKKYIAVENTSSLFEFDTETEQINDLPIEREALRSITLIKEPGVLVDNGTEIPVKSGDLIVRFYEHSFEKHMIVVKSKDWKNNLIAYNKMIEKQRADALKQKAESCIGCDDDCEMCCEG